MTSLKRFYKLIAFFSIVLFGTFLFDSINTHAASSPYDVPSNVRTGWSSTYGHKTYDMRTGKNLVYDIYSNKYISGGYQIVNRTFSGHSNQPYLRFTGWAVNLGHKHHTASNHETYIVAQRTSDNTTKIYSTLPINISATEDVEYNNQGAGVTNQCPSSAINKSNIPSQDNGCNMTYVNVGFDAYLPLNELVPDKNSNTSWRLYIVKRVDSHIVYTELILPFSLSNLSFNSDTITGKISLSSGVNANQLMMRSTTVMRRTSARQTGVSGSTLGYFITGKYYTRTTQDESGTSVWYGVSDGGTKWANSAYWAFGGSQAVISYDAPPKHNSAAITGHKYRNNSDHWTIPNSAVNIELRQYDQTGNARQYLSIYGSGVDARAWHDYGNSSSTWFDYFLPKPKSPHVDITGAQRLENSGGYAKVRWNVTPKTHGHTYDVQYYYQDSAANTIGYNKTGLRLRVDGVAPVLTWSDIQNARYVDGNTYWYQPNDTATVKLQQRDVDSGNRMSYLRLAGNGVDQRYRHRFLVDASNHIHPFWMDGNGTFHQGSSDPNISFVSGGRETAANTYGQVAYRFSPKTHGHKYAVEYYFDDNVGNASAYNPTGKTIGVDGVAPTVQFRNSADTANFTSRDWSSAEIRVRLKHSDPHSGYKQSRYQWSTSTTTPSTWSSWTSSSNYEATKSGSGQWYLHVQTEDNAGNLNTTYSGPYKFNTPPVANFTWSPSTIYNDTNVSLNNSSSDADGHTLTHQWAYQEPGSSTWVNFSTAVHPSKIFNKKGNWNIRLTVSDGIDSDSITKILVVQNRPPVANFSWSPTTIYNDTNVTFTNSSTDADKDSLTYQWAYQEPGSSTWVNFSTVTSPNRVFNKKGTWNVRLTTSDGTTTHSVSKSLTVRNRAPIANFSWSPSTIYNDTSVTFSNSSTDADKDSLTYKWEYQEPNSTTWVSFSTAVNPTKILNKQEVWKIRLTVSDGTASHSVTKSITVLNRTPIPNFTATPNPTDRLTTVNFKNTSSDPDKDNLTYIWEYRIKGTSTWTRMATSTNASFKFPKVATYEIRLTASDKWISASKILDVVVKNIKPVVELSYELPTSPLPNEVWEGDTVKVCVKVTDAEKDPMTVKIHIKKDGGTAKLVLNQSNLTSGSRPCYTFVTEVGRYDIPVSVDDGYDVVETSTWFYSKQLTLSGDVKHTPDWLAKHNELNHTPYQFYSGERFLLEGYTSPYPTNYVKATLQASHTNGASATRIVTLNKISEILYKGELYDKLFQEHGTTLKEGPASFEFEVQYTNGIIKKHIVPIEIIGDGYEQYRIHRKY